MNTSSSTGPITFAGPIFLACVCCSFQLLDGQMPSSIQQSGSGILETVKPKNAIKYIRVPQSSLVTLQGINISHLGIWKIIFKMPFLGDILVSWRVCLVDLVGLGASCLFSCLEHSGTMYIHSYPIKRDPVQTDLPETATESETLAGPAWPRHPAAGWWEDATCSWSTSCPLLLLSGNDHPLLWFRHAKRCWRPKPYHGQRAKARNLSWGWRMHDESASHCCETTLKQHAWTCFKVTNPKWFPIAWRKRSWPAWHPLPSFTSSACSIILLQETECPHHSLFHGARFPAFPLALGACLVAGSDDPSTHSWSTDDMSLQFHSRLITDVFVSFVLEGSVLLTDDRSLVTPEIPSLVAVTNVMLKFRHL